MVLLDLVLEMEEEEDFASWESAVLALDRVVRGMAISESNFQVLRTLLSEIKCFARVFGCSCFDGISPGSRVQWLDPALHSERHTPDHQSRDSLETNRRD